MRRKLVTMIRQIFAIRDTKGGYYNQPFPQNSHGEAERTFADLVNEKSTTISRHPKDYDLYHLGHFDDNAGVLTAKQPEFIINGEQLVTKVQ